MPDAQTLHQVVDGFRAAMQEAGITPPDHIDTDGELHRFTTNGKAGDKAGYYALHTDGTPAGFFGCWRSGTYQTWTASGGRRLSDQDRQRLQAARDDAKRERERRYKARAAVAGDIWNAAGAPDPAHPYLKSKCIDPVGDIRQADAIPKGVWMDDDTRRGALANCLLIPVRGVDGRIQSLQAITPNGDKWFLAGGRMAGGMLLIPGDEGRVICCEGYATGATLQTATGATVAVAFNAGNLCRVAEAVRRIHPDADMVIAGDNDHKTEGNPGQTAAEDAAAAVGATVALPEFAPGEQGTDWNDYAASYGMDALVDALPLKDDKPDAGRQFGFTAIGDLVGTLKPIDWLVKGYFESDSLAVVYGEPGHGKSFCAIDVACCVATGTDWHGHQVKSGSVAYIAGEGHNGLARRFKAWELANGVDLAGAPLFVSTMAAPLNDVLAACHVADAVRTLVDQTGKQPALIIVDTLARNFNADENSAADMGQFVGNLDRHLRVPWGATVMVVHHSGKDATKGARGSTALRGAVDAEYQVERDETGIVRMQAHKMKDAEQPDPLAFKLEGVKLPLAEEDGSPVFGAALRGIEYVAPAKRGSEGRGKNQTKALAALNDLLDEHQQRLIDGGQSPDGARVRIDDWRDRCGFDRKTWHKVKTSLEKGGKVAFLPGGYVEPVF
ncbi:AAA family ATPase [Microbulbifer thermotolerans]|uniref:AAA family ATPase n=1 Tax=Microbulbifer thermotolerans TaxID=252514 RepID=UPI0009427C71|nr:AAA family ATPase [Microbulbifer thermotolerans]